MPDEPSRPVTQKCPSCGRTFKPKRADAIYCSGACRQRGHRARAHLSDLDRQIEATRLKYWELIYQKARALGRQPSQIVTGEAQYIDLDGNVWVGGVLGGGDWRRAGKVPKSSRDGWSTWGFEAAGPPWTGPALVRDKGVYEKEILGRPPIKAHRDT